MSSLLARKDRSNTYFVIDSDVTARRFTNQFEAAKRTVPGDVIIRITDDGSVMGERAYFLMTRTDGHNTERRMVELNVTE